MNNQSGFIRIIISIIVLIGLLFFSGIDFRELISNFDLQANMRDGYEFTENFYAAHLQSPLERFVFTPAANGYAYLKIYVIDVIVEFLRDLL